MSKLAAVEIHQENYDGKGNTRVAKFVKFNWELGTFYDRMAQAYNWKGGRVKMFCNGADVTSLFR